MIYRPEIFTVKLIHDPQTANKLEVDVPIELEFKFDPDKFIIQGKEVNHTLRGRSKYLKISSFDSNIRKYIYENKYSNPISSGMPIVVLIIATKDNYIIRINEGDDIYYPLIFPPWSINRVEITGAIDRVIFDEDSHRCLWLTQNLPKFELNERTKRVEKQLNSKSEVIIRGKIPNPFHTNISVNFLHAAITFDETCVILYNESDSKNF
uniref:Galectin domain-containing protein n=1 Tax=Meloidogyne enterolobii TaxID=390850 RepID=A0A6V7UGD7_MELEN|nr:unnamed protein product [Meloidogyne enterolobii]